MRPSRGYRAIQVERIDRTVVLTLDRPHVLNAYDTVMRDEVFATLDVVARDPGVSALVVRGAGRAFSSGGDLNEFGTAPSPTRAREVRQVRDVWRRWAEVPCISIAAVHGVAAGGGLEMALLCDLVLCTRDARLGLPETGLGLVPGVGGTQTLPRRVGVGRAAAMLLAGTWIDGRQAVQMGLAQEVVPRARLLARALSIAAEIGALDPDLMRAVKAAVRRGEDLSLAAALRLERRLAGTLPPRSA